MSCGLRFLSRRNPQLVFYRELLELYRGSNAGEWLSNPCEMEAPVCL